MQCSFGWDVTPAYPSSGIYKPIFLEAFDAAAIRYIKFVSRQGHKGWSVTITTILDSPGDFKGTLKVTLRNTTHILIDKAFQVNPNMIQAADSGVAVTVEEALPLSAVAMWWPNGMDSNKRALYDLTVSARAPKSSGESTKKTVRVGFRMISVLQPSIKEVVGDPEAEGAGFHFRVNGQAVFIKGASLAPVHMLPEKATKQMVDKLLDFAASSHMNMIRVWGQGMYESDYLYAKADELGIMIWQDFSFGNSMYPATVSFLQNVEKEALHQVRRLQHHASLAMLCGNNENEVYTQLFCLTLTLMTGLE